MVDQLRDDIDVVEAQRLVDIPLDDAVRERAKVLRRDRTEGRGRGGRGGSEQKNERARNQQSRRRQNDQNKPRKTDQEYKTQQERNSASDRRSQMPNQDENGRRILTVSGQTASKSLAGAIAHISREFESPIVLAGGPGGVNQTVKAISIARKYLEQNGLDISCYCEPSSTDRRRNDQRNSPSTGGFRFTISKCALRRNRHDEKEKEMKISKTSKPGMVAGAIAKRIRDGERVCITCIGPASVFNAVQSISIARQYLYRDNFDLSFKPEFVNVVLENDVRSSAVRFFILAQQV